MWRKNFTAIVSDQNVSIRGKLAFKTKEVDWLDTEAPSIALISIHSAFHQGVNGDLKMRAFLSTIKNHTQGRLTILLADIAHIHAFSSENQLTSDDALIECIRNAQKIAERFRSSWVGCNVEYWHNYICKDENYEPSMKFVRTLFQQDSFFRDLVCTDAENTVKRRVQSSDSSSLIEKTAEDILEQCVCIKVLSHKGYHFQIYPGSSYKATEYINKTCVIPVTWVDV
jgi:hypothetical protein